MGGALQAGQQQQIGDQPLQPAALAEHPIQTGRRGGFCLGRRWGAYPRMERSDRTAQAAAFGFQQGQQIGQGRAQLMGDIGAELLLPAVSLQQGRHRQPRQPPAGQGHACHRQSEHAVAQPPKPAGLRIEGCQAAADLQGAPVLLTAAMGSVQMDCVAQQPLIPR